MSNKEKTSLTRKQVGDRLRRARLQAGFIQEQLAKKIDVSQPMISLWEKGKQSIQEEDKAKLIEVLGNFFRQSDTEAKEVEPEVASAFGVWLSKTRTEKGMSVPELASKSEITAPAIYNIESGKSHKSAKRNSASIGERARYRNSFRSYKRDRKSAID